MANSHLFRRWGPAVGIVTVAVVTLTLMTPIPSAEGQDMPASEKLITALLETHTEIDPRHHVFLLWRGYVRKSKNRFEIVILKREGKTMIMIDSAELVKIIGKKKKRGWVLEGLTDVGSILTFDSIEGNLEAAIEERFEIAIVGKATIFLGT